MAVYSAPGHITVSWSLDYGIKSFTEDIFFLKIFETYSPSLYIVCGVPHGSVFGPKLLYINGINLQSNEG